MRLHLFLSAALAACPIAVVGAQAPAPVVANPTGAITLREAVVLALAQSPDLAAFDAGRRVAEATALQAGRLPNPMLGTLVEDVGGSSRSLEATGPVQPQVTAQLSQLVELGGKRAARQRLAGLDRDLATWDYEAARLDVLTRVSTAFLEVLAAQRAVAHAAQTLDVAQQVRRTVTARVAAGVVSPIEETRAEVLTASAQLEADRARRTLEARRRQLAGLWGSRTADFASAAGDLDTLPAIPALEALEASLARNPDFARWVAEVERRRAAVTLARSARVPDVTLSAGYRRFTSIEAQAFVVGASVPLPWFDRNRDGIRAAEAAVEQATSAARAAQLDLLGSLADAHRQLASAGDDVNSLRTRVIPGARSVFDAVQEGYQLGRFGLMDVLDAQRTLVTANGQYLQALTTYHHAVASVERLVGQSLGEFPLIK